MSRGNPRHPSQGTHRHHGDGVEDKLVPLEALDPLKIQTFDELVRAMSKTAFSGRSLGEACDVLEAMVRDEDCLVVATFSGAMTVAKMGVVIVRMIEAGMKDQSSERFLAEFNRVVEGYMGANARQKESINRLLEERRLNLRMIHNLQTQLNHANASNKPKMVGPE